MGRLRLRTLALLLLMAGGVSGPCARADSASAEERLRAALRETTTQLRQAQDDLATLRAEHAAQRAAPPPPVVAPPSRPAPAVDLGLQRKLSAQAAQLDEVKQQLEATQQTLQKWQAGYQQAAELARSKDAESNTYKAALDDLSGRHSTCVADNTSLVQLSKELVQSYRNKGVFSALVDAEPFTRIHRVKLEALAQHYDGKIIEGEVSKDPVPPTAKAGEVPQAAQAPGP